VDLPDDPELPGWRVEQCSGFGRRGYRTFKVFHGPGGERCVTRASALRAHKSGDQCRPAATMLA